MILVLTDLTQMSLEKVRAAVELVDSQFSDETIIYPQGLISGVSFSAPDESVEDELKNSKNSWRPFSSKEIKENFSNFSHKFIISTSEEVHKALILEFNLEGRTDFKFVRFKAEDNLEIFRQGLSSVKESVNEVLNVVSDLKLMVSSIYSSLPKEMQQRINSKYVVAKSILDNSLQISSDFINFVQSKPSKLVQRKEVLEEFLKSSELLSSVDLTSVFQTWEKVAKREDFNKFLEEKVVPQSMINDGSLMTTLASISSSVKQKSNE